MHDTPIARILDLIPDHTQDLRGCTPEEARAPATPYGRSTAEVRAALSRLRGKARV